MLRIFLNVGMGTKPPEDWIRTDWKWGTHRLGNASRLNWFSDCIWALSIGPNIPVWNSGFSTWRMEEYFSVGWTNPSQFITFQVTKQTKRKQTAESLPFWPFLLALELINDSEVEKNDVLGEDDDMTFKSSRRLLWRYDTSLFPWRVQESLSNDEASCSLTRSNPHYAKLTCIFAPL